MQMNTVKATHKRRTSSVNSFAVPSKGNFQETIEIRTRAKPRGARAIVPHTARAFPPKRSPSFVRHGGHATKREIERDDDCTGTGGTGEFWGEKSGGEDECERECDEEEIFVCGRWERETTRWRGEAGGGERETGDGGEQIETRDGVPVSHAV